MNTPPTHRLHTPDARAEADEREFEAFAQAQDPLDIEAATWVARRRNGLSADGEAELQAWRNADPRHAEAFEDMDATLGDVQQLPDDDMTALKAGLAQAPAARPPRSAEPRRRPWLLDCWGQFFPQAAAAALAVAMVGGGWMGWERWRQLPTFEQSFVTQKGQQLTATLPDASADSPERGSTLHLDTATRLEARLYRDHREVRLADGQAMFTVKSDAERPFHVRAGALRITVVGTRFSVRHTPSGLGAGQTIVSVEEGRVRVAKADLADGRDDVLSTATQTHAATVELAAGQMVVADDAGHIGPVTSVTASSIAPWRNGRISFDQTPLAQAIAEFERYGHTGVVVRDPGVAALPVGGSYSLKQWQRFAETLPQVLPVRLERRGELLEVVAQ
ncbi:FecR domain-containing protein [Hydrogenophaga sp.]|uniref:FecR family protein n=1 Tax=Hydrogenophaga sp. TaxID=1904254 RepID=UPI0025BE3645|nr:FecR domain-containing protein [Hydrogenophaga sp.]MBT9464640.1 FecR domain-containing protein [Hydrogenophaga sp.]